MLKHNSINKKGCFINMLGYDKNYENDKINLNDDSTLLAINVKKLQTIFIACQHNYMYTIYIYNGCSRPIHWPLFVLGRNPQYKKRPMYWSMVAGASFHYPMTGL